MMKAQRKKLQLTLSFSAKDTTKGKKEAIVIQTMGGFFPIAIMKLECQIENLFYEEKEVYQFACLSGKHVQQKEMVDCKVCGRLQAMISSYELIDLLGLWKKRYPCKADAQMLVMPPYMQSSTIEELGKHGMEKEKEIARRSGFQSDDSYEIKEYQEGDSLKRIHHKMTYKLQKPMVRQYANLEQAQIVLQLDMRGNQEIVERTLTTFHTTARIFLTQGLQLKCAYFFQHQPHTVEMTQLSTIRQVLSDILSVPRDESIIEKKVDDIQYRIHGYELMKLQDKEGPYNGKTSSL